MGDLRRLPLIAVVLLVASGSASGSDGTYAGRSLDASCREAAAERIERHRKARLAVVVTDGRGRPVASAYVRVRMLRHAFGFGTAVAARELLGESEDSRVYRAKIPALFTKAVLENDLKWPFWERERRRALDAVAWLRRHGLAVRGHTLVWPDWQHLPGGTSLDLAASPNGVRARFDAVARERGDAAARDWLRGRVDAHVREEVGALRGRLVEWDVLNEPYTSHELTDVLGRAELARWFQLARQADPGAKLYVNDFGIVEDAGLDAAHQAHLADSVSFLLSRGAPLDGIGLQSHFDSELTPPATVYAILDRFAAFGKALQVTEFDVDIADERLQADYTRDFMTIAFSHPAVVGFVVWGFWEGRHWRSRGAMYRRDWSEKPNGAVYRELVFRRWWTDVRGRTGRRGAFATRGFLGSYVVTATKAGRSRSVRVRLDRGGTAVRIALPRR